MNGQNWSLQEQFSPTTFAGSSVGSVLARSDGGHFLTISCRESISIAGTTLEPSGEELSSFLLARDNDGTVLWTLEVESGDITGIDSLPTGDLVVVCRADAGCSIGGVDPQASPNSQIMLTVSALDGSVEDMLVMTSTPVVMSVSTYPDGKKLLHGICVNPGTIDLPSGPLQVNFNGSFFAMLDEENNTVWSASSETENGGLGMIVPFMLGTSDGSLILMVWTVSSFGSNELTFMGETFLASEVALTEVCHLISISANGEVQWRLSPPQGSTSINFGQGARVVNEQIEFISTQSGPIQLGSVSIPGPSSALVRLGTDGVPVGYTLLDAEALANAWFEGMPNGGSLVSGICQAGTVIGGLAAPSSSEGLRYVAELNDAGDWNWVQFFDGSVDQTQWGIEYDGQNDIYLFGYTNEALSVNGIPIVNPTVNPRAFFMRFERSCMTVSATTIEPADCDVPLAGSVAIEVSGGDEPYTYSWSNGSTNAQLTGVDGGVHAVTVIDDAGCQEVEYFYVPGPVDQVGEVVGYFDGWPYFRPGIETNTTAALWSSGCEGDSVRMTVVLDPRVTYLEGLLGVDLQSGDTLRLDMGAIDEQGAYQDRELVLITDVTANIGDTLCFQVELDVISSGAATIIDVFERCYPVVNSYDPNDKSVVPAGDGPEGRIPFDQEKLTYLVRFQNTGNAPAFDVFIDDTLDTDLDLMGLEVIASSHPMVLEIQDRTLRFRFDDINLPDSASNEPESHGYVLYRIPIVAGSNIGTRIRNTAYIFFDLNPAIITNTTLSTLSLEVGVDETSDLVDRLTVHPNPTPGRITLELDQGQLGGVIRLFDTSGSLVSQAVINDTTTVVDLEGLQPGLYFVKVGARTTRVVKMDPLGGTR